MKIILDGLIFALQKQGGISVYWKELSMRAGYDSIDVDLILYNVVNNSNQNEIEKLQDLRQKIQKRKFFLPIWLTRFIPFIRSTGKAIFHSSYLNVVLSKNAINVITIHDLGYERGLTQTGFKRKIHLFFKYFTLRWASGFICISEFTKNEFLSYYPFCEKKKIKVIYNGVSKCFYRKSKTSQIEFDENPFILFVGTRYSYKRFSFLVNALEQLTTYSLVIVGGGPLSDSETLLLNKKLKKRYTHYSEVTDQALNDLYNSAHCLVYPSAYEGFGIPLVEAMRAGCPFIACRCGAIPEIVGDAGVLISADASKNELMDAIQSLALPEKRINVIETGKRISDNYSWDKCYEQTKSFYKELFEKSK